jgi:hypothetical protein
VQRGAGDTRVGDLLFEIRTVTDGVDIYVGDTGVSSVGVSGWPAHQLDTVVAQVDGRGQDLVERVVGENGADKAQREGGIHGAG